MMASGLRLVMGLLSPHRIKNEKRTDDNIAPDGSAREQNRVRHGGTLAWSNGERCGMLCVLGRSRLTYFW
jgi:hypothetical protein